MEKKNNQTLNFVNKLNSGHETQDQNKNIKKQYCDEYHCVRWHACGQALNTYHIWLQSFWYYKVFQQTPFREKTKWQM